LTITGKISKIVPATVGGNTHYYVMLEGMDAIFDVSVVDYIDIIRYEVGDEITMEYQEETDKNIVLSLK